MESEVCKDSASISSRKVKEARINLCSGISKSCEDPMPEYVSPELVMLIAQNAPSELDVFKRSSKHRSKLPARAEIGRLDWQQLRGWTRTAIEDVCKKDTGVQVLLSSGKERHHTLKQFRMDGRRSCPEVMTWSDYDTEGSRGRRVKNVKRKRPKSLDLCKPASRNTDSPISASSPMDDQAGVTVDEELSSPKSVDFNSFGIDQKPEELRPASAPAVSASRYESDALNAKPWRHGMKKKRISTELIPAETISCKRKSEIDPKKHSEVKKYMETKFAQLRNERLLQKARTEAALAARKEKQRKLDAECQALLKSQAADVKIKQKTFSRPPWTSEYVTLAEAFRPWSRASTGDLPPPKIPRNQEPVPLDLYTSISTYEAAQKSSRGGGCKTPSFSKAGTKRRSKKSKTKDGVKQLRGKTMTSDMYEMAFPPTHPYHALHPNPQNGTRKKLHPLTTKARWKSRGNSLTKRFNIQKIYQLQLPPKKKCVDLMAYRRTPRTSRTPHSGSICRDARAPRMQKHSKSSYQNGYTNVLEQDDCYAISALKEHERDFCTRNKVKRLKPTSNQTAEQTSPPQFDLKAKYSPVRSFKRDHVAVDSNELSLQDVAKVMKLRLSFPDSRRETVHQSIHSVSPDKIHSRKCRRYASLSPRKHLRDEAILQVPKPRRTELVSPRRSLRNGAKSQGFVSVRPELLGPDKHLRDGSIMQALRPRRKDTANVDTEISKDVTRVIRRQRMHTLRSLAEQLVKRVDAACAEQLLQNTPKTFSEPTLESHVDTNYEPFNKPVGLHCLDEPLEVEPKFYYQSTQPDILYHGHLSELEQAGCETVELWRNERTSGIIPSLNDLSKDPCTAHITELNVSRDNVVSPHDWRNVTDKGMSISDNIPSGCSSYGPSSPSTDSSSPVILPTGAKYNIRRIKRNKNVEEQARKRQKEAWTLPAEEDIHSVINLYTQHWLSREKKKNRARCELSEIGQGECEENTSSRSKSRTSFHEHAPEKHKFKFGAAPMCSELQVSEPCIRSSESNCCGPMKCAELFVVNTDLLENDHRESVPYIMKEGTGEDVHVANSSSSLEKSVATTEVEPRQGDDSEKKTTAVETSQRKPGGMLVQIGDLRLCQSPTSFHLRLDTLQDDHQLKNSSRDLDTVTFSKMESTAADAYTPLVRSSEDLQSETFKASIAPMKITYARRLRTRTKPDGASTDERIVLEVHHISAEGGEPARQICSTDVKSSGSSTSGISTANLEVNVVKVQKLENPAGEPNVQNDCQKSKDGIVRSNLLQTGTHLTSYAVPMAPSQVNGASGKGKFQKIISKRIVGKNKNSEAERNSTSNSPVERSEESLDQLPTNGRINLVGEKGYSDLHNTTDKCEERLDGLPTKPSDLLEMPVCSNMDIKLCSDEAENCWENGEDQEIKQNDSIDSSNPSTYGSLSTFDPKTKSHYMKSVLHDSAEKRLELRFESKREFRPDVKHNGESTRERQLKSRRDQLEAELQKLDAEIKKTRGKLQTSQTVVDTKTRKHEESGPSVAAVEKRTFSDYSDSFAVGEGLPDNLISARLYNPLQSSRALSDSPQKLPAFISKAAVSASLRTLDRKLGSPIHSNSFVSEDIQMQEEILSSRTFEMIPDTVREKCGNHYELSRRDPTVMNQNLKQCESKTTHVRQDVTDQPAKEVSEEEKLNCRIMCTQDEVVDEGSENSTGRIPFRFESSSKRGEQEATIHSASPRLKRGSSPDLDGSIVYLPHQELQSAFTGQRREVLSTVAVKTNPISKVGEDFTYGNEMKVTPSFSPWDRDAEIVSKDADLMKDKRSRSSNVTSTNNRRELYKTAKGENVSGNRKLVSPRRAMLADEVYGVIDEDPSRSMKEDGKDAQWYVAGVQSSLQFQNSSIEGSDLKISVPKIVFPQKFCTSSPTQELKQVGFVEEDSISSDGAKPRTSEVVQHSSRSARDVLGINSKANERDFKELRRNGIKMRKKVEVLPSSSSDGILKESKSGACVNDPSHPFNSIFQQTSKINTKKSDGSFNTDEIGKCTNVFSADDTGMVFHHSTPQQERKGAPLERTERVASRENSDGLTIRRDSLEDEAQEMVPPNFEEVNSLTISFQDKRFSNSESGRIRQQWSLDSEVSQNLTEDSKEEIINQLMQRENLFVRKSEDDRLKVVTNLPYPDVNSNTLNMLVSGIGPEKVCRHNQEQITSGVSCPMCFQLDPGCPILVFESTVTDGSLEVISRPSATRTEERRNVSKFPHSEPPLSQSSACSIAKAPGRSQWSLHDPGSDVTSDQIRASTELDESTDSSSEAGKQVVTSLAKEQARSPLSKEVPESFRAGFQNGNQCHPRNPEKAGMENWDRPVRPSQENDGKPTLLHKGIALTVPDKTSEIGEVSKNILKPRITDECSSTTVREVTDNFITTHGDEFDDRYHWKQICQRPRPLKPSPSMLKNKVDYQERGNIDSDVTEIPPVYSQNSKPLEMEGISSTESRASEYLKVDNLTSGDQQEAHFPCTFGTPTHDAELPMLVDKQTGKDCNPLKYGEECTSELITSTRGDKKADLTVGIKSSRPATNSDLARSQPKQQVSLFSSLYGKGGRAAIFTSESSDVSDELENFDSELDEKLENNMETRLTSEYVEVEQQSLLNPRSLHHSDPFWNSSETSCVLGRESLRVVDVHLGTDLNTENLDDSVEKQGENSWTKNSSEAQHITNNFSMCENVEVQYSHAVRPISRMNLKLHGENFFTTFIPPEDDVRDCVEAITPTGTEDLKPISRMNLRLHGENFLTTFIPPEDDVRDCVEAITPTGTEDLKPISRMNLKLHGENFLTTFIPPEDDVRDFVEAITPTGTEDFKLQDTGDVRADIKFESGTDLEIVEHSQKYASLMFTTLSGTWLRSLDTKESRLSSNIENELERLISIGGSNKNGGIVRAGMNSMNLDHNADVATDLDDLADQEYSVLYSSRECSEPLTDPVTCTELGWSTQTTVLKKYDNDEMICKAVQEDPGVVSNSGIEGGTAKYIQVHVRSSSACEKSRSRCHTEFGVSQHFPVLPVELREHEESLMMEDLDSKLSGSSTRLGEDFCLTLPKCEVGNLYLPSESSWPKDKGKLDEPQNTLAQSADRRFDGKEALKVDLERVEGHEEDHVLTNRASDVEFITRMSEPHASWLPDEAHRLVECFLSSGSELLDRASHVSRALSSCSVETSCPKALLSLDSSDHRMVRTPLQASYEEGTPFSSTSGPSKILSSSSPTKMAEDGQRQLIFPCEPDVTEIPEFLNPSRPDQIMALRSSNSAYWLGENSTLNIKPPSLDVGKTRDPTDEHVKSRFATLSRHEEISAQELTASESFPSRDSSSRIEVTLVPSEIITRSDMQHELEINRSCCELGQISTETEISEFREFMNSVTSSVPQLASDVSISLQIPEGDELRTGSGTLHYTDSNCDDDKNYLSEVEAASEDHPLDHLQSNEVEFKKNSALSTEGSGVYVEVKAQFLNLDTTQEAQIIPDSKENSLCRLFTENTSTATCHDQDSTCSIAGSGESQDLDGTVEDMKREISANRAGKHNLMADTLTDMLFETLLVEGLSDVACPSRWIARASSEANRSPLVSKTPKPKIKSRSNIGFVGVLKHFLPTGWRAASAKHKTGLFLQVEGLRQHQLTFDSVKSSSVSGMEGMAIKMHNNFPSPDDFEQSGSEHRTTTETTISLLASKEYVQSYVKQTLELSSLLSYPRPSNWYDSKTPVGQDISRTMMETLQSSRFGTSKLGDSEVQNKLLSDLVNESLIKYSSTIHQSPSILPFVSVDGGHVVQFVTGNIIDDGTSVSKHGPDIDKVVGKLLEDEHWEKCYEEARDLISDLAQEILCDLIERFVQEMIFGRNITVAVNLVCH